jgi:DNA-binding NarL/FixJ family response regulator
MASTTPRSVAIDAAVIASRAFRMSGSPQLALTPLELCNGARGDGSGHDVWVVLEAVRVIGGTGVAAESLDTWTRQLDACVRDTHEGIMRAARAEIAAWTAHVDGDRATAARCASEAQQRWRAAQCEEEVALCQELLELLSHTARHAPERPATPLTQPSLHEPQVPAAWTSLTRREREIAQHVAAGMTNPEIAASLVLSTRTVEHHVASILRKLELPNRRAIARDAHAPGA